MKKAYIASVIGVVVILFFAPLAALAQSPKVTTSPRGKAVAKPIPITPPDQPTVGIDLTLSPVFFTLTTDPGKAVTTNVKVTNNNNITEYLQVQLVRFAPDEKGEITLFDLEPNDEFKNWISFSDEQFVIGPTETKIVKVTVDPPQDAALGYYYAVLISRIGQNIPGKGQAVVAGSPALPLLLEVRSPNAKREAQLVDFKTTQMFYEYLPVTFEVTMKNTGNIHLAPSGDIFLDWGNAKNVAILPVNEGRGNVLPNTQRTYSTSWQDGFAVRQPKTENGKEVLDKDGNPVFTTKYDFAKADKFRIGKYTARVIMVYDNGERDVPVEAKISFWVIPWKFILGGLVIVVIVLFGLKSIFSGLFKRKSK